MAESSKADSSATKAAVSAPKVVLPFTAGPTLWKSRKRPPEVEPLAHDPQRLERVHFDAQFAAATVLGKWEDEWPLLSERQFDASMKSAAEIECGGHNPDGSHPRSPKAKE